MIKALIVSENIHFVEKVVNEIGVNSLDINISRISTSLEAATTCSQGNGPDIVFSDAEIYKRADSLSFKEYPDNFLVMSENEIFKTSILEQIHNIAKDKNLIERKTRITNELTNLGYCLKYSGTRLLVETILLISQSKNRKKANLQSGIFPIVAKNFDKTTHNVKASINRATDSMYAECNIEKLKEYFHFSNDIRPTLKQVVFAVLEHLEY